MRSSLGSLLPSSRRFRFLAAIIASSLIGFGISLYLTIERFTGGIVPCSIFTGCEKVLSSPYAQILGIPTALLGVGYYIVVYLFAIMFADNQKKIWTRFIQIAASAGFAVTCWLLFVQFGLLQVLCPYCLVSAVCCGIIFSFSWVRK